MKKIFIASFLILGACASTKPQISIFEGQKGLGAINQIQSAQIQFAGKDGMGPEAMYVHNGGHNLKDEFYLGERYVIPFNDKFSTYLGTGTCLTVQDASLAVFQAGHYTSAGAEYSINKNLSFILDYRYVMWGESGSLLGGNLSLGVGWQF